MNAPGSVLAWVCAAVVALPLSPCAFFSSTCCHKAEAGETASADQAAERPCCAEHSQPVERPAKQDREQPCQGDCCLLSPFAQTAEKVVLASPLAIVALAVGPSDVSPAGEAFLPTSAAPQPLSLQVLHCQWRL
jgi:hypothetical protein